MPLVAGVDSSTQSCKVVIVDAETGVLVRSGRASHPGGTEVDPVHWWSALLEAIDEAGGLGDVSAVSIGGQQHGMVLLDSDGVVIRDALLWNDTRSAPEALEIITEFGAENLAKWTGSVPVASFTSTKLRWVRNHESENASRVAAVCLPHDYLSWRLAGYGPVAQSQFGPDLTKLATDASDASGTGYFSSKSMEYLPKVLEFVLGHVPLLPRVVMPHAFAYAPNGKNSLTAAGIAAGAGDNAAAGFGLGASTGDVVVSLGTSGTVFAVTDMATSDATGTIAGFASASGNYLPLVCTLNAARVLDSFATLLGVDHQGLSQLAVESQPGAHGVVLVPYFEGERTPNLPSATASLHGLTLDNNTANNLVRAAIEGMLCGLADGLEAILQAGVTCNRVILIGGAAASRAVQIAASQIFGKPVFVPKPGEYVANGAARQAAWVLSGHLPHWRVAELATLEPDFQPQILGSYRRIQAIIANSQAQLGSFE
jgi:xylulokinase